ncbi:IMP cyclohydrolase [Desulfolutivibrio sulfoxidireducens]|uniref:IMP cyclohydrolase n=1 Tax=Desulfolutivibrio sulfoxidireducens TaxID=2773299 RepID=UPI00159DE820|nr:IMP cyclohydrolase [Desulfolutivibrio sulfoxidireducens]QLA17500.1 IMP cyclohydrolase [Desulfolutivibrio sulfoxidireducens]QLA21085.1 IMP cyclohydrolase [Desulfolutivibrio sulfoxidireducens]
MELLPVRRALVSVTDKTGLVSFAEFLQRGGVEIVSTGGTRKMLQDAGLAVTSVSRVTGFPEILDGRVKTLHPNIHAGILADKDNPEHRRTLAKHHLAAFDLVCVNLYDFAAALKAGLSLKDMVERIDIGGPCLLRASAKNFQSILVVPGPGQYPRVQRELLDKDFHAGLPLRRELAAATFKLTAEYDALIAAYLAG